MVSLQFQALENVFPWSAVRPFQLSGSFGVANNLLGLGIPVDLAAKVQRYIRQVARDCCKVAVLDVGNRALARLDAIDEIAYVQIELLRRRAGFTDRFCPRLRLNLDALGARLEVDLRETLVWRCRGEYEGLRVPGNHFG